MKVILFNGSRREHGCTYTALNIIAKALKENGVDSEIFFIGERAVNGDVDKLVEEAVEAVNGADGIVVGTPVYYASPSGEVVSFLDRLFISPKANLRLKPAAAIASARRAGTTASIDMLLKYFTIKEMPVVSSRYWPMVHGNSPEEVLKDEEGVQIMEVLGRNMAWLLKSIEAGKAAGIAAPEPVKQIKTNFIK